MKTLVLLLSIAGAASAQMQNNTAPTLACDSRGGGNSDQARHCEMREQTAAYSGQLVIDAGTNGGVTVKGANRSDVLVRMKVEGYAPTQDEARSLASQVRVSTSAGRVAADGPKGEGNRGWSVSYEIFTPHQANIEVKANNGGVRLSDLHGTLRFTVNNGGVHLDRVDGSVSGSTVNGGVHVALTGTRWDGTGLDVTTTNGGVHVELPAAYSAQLEAATTNGGIHSDFGDAQVARRDRHLKANIGSGGALLRLTTTNGGVRVVKI